jgi:uncharacterized membrane protein YvlD (DUF360 family)
MNKNVTRWLIVWVINAVVIYLAYLLNPVDIVLGTYRMSAILAAVFSGLLITAITRLVKLSKITAKIDFLKGRYLMFVFYGLVNTAGVWLIARFAWATGLGISSFVWAFVLGFALCFGQWLVRQGFKTFKL